MVKQRKIIHIDMDCFYAAIEMRDNPSLLDKPIAIGGLANSRGVICTSNYRARQYGVQSAMASFQALKQCPQLILIPPNFVKYQAASNVIHAIFRRHTNIIEPLSLDEAFLDVSISTELHGSATRIAEMIRQEIWESQQLTSSAGVAPNKFLAKVASDWNKPNGLCVITPHHVQTFIATLPVEKISGVGPVTAKKMHHLDIKTCGDLQHFPSETLRQHFGNFGKRLFNLCRGHDERPVETNRIRKSVSVEHTFSADLTTKEQCMNALDVLFVKLQQRLTKHQNRKLHKQFVKIKFEDFQLTTIECLSTEINLHLFQHLYLEGYQRHQRPIRLLGVGVYFLCHEDNTEQLEFAW